MNSNAALVVRARIIVAATIKFLGLLLFMIGFFGPLLSWIIEGVVDDDLLHISYYLVRIINAAVLCLSGVLLFTFGERAASIMCRVPPNTCPKCRFNLENFRADRCPECGLYLGEDFHAPPPVNTAPEVSRTDVQSPPAASQE